MSTKSGIWKQQLPSSLTETGKVHCIKICIIISVIPFLNLVWSILFFVSTIQLQGFLIMLKRISIWYMTRFLIFLHQDGRLFWKVISLSWARKIGSQLRKHFKWPCSIELPYPISGDFCTLKGFPGVQDQWYTE